MQNSNHPKVILFFPNPLPFKPFQDTAPLSLLAIARMLLDKYDVKVIDERFCNLSNEELVNECRSAICVGISAMTGYQIERAVNFAKLVRISLPDKPIIWGGWHPSICPEQTAKDSNVDFVVIGQGEITFSEIVDCITKGGNPFLIRGIAFREGEKVIFTEPRPFEDINKFPPMPYHLVGVSNYIRDYGIPNQRHFFAGYISSQGCVFNCRFCADRKVYHRKWSALDADRVVNEIEDLVKRYQIDSVCFEDSNFFVNKKRAYKVAEDFIKHGLNIFWESMGHPGQLMHFEDEFFSLLRKSGYVRMLIGSESGSQKVLDLIDKKATVEDSINLVKKLRKFDIVPIVSLMVGLYEDPKEDFDATLRLVAQLKRIDNNLMIKIFLYTPYPGTYLYEDALKHGLKEPSTLEEWSKFTLYKVPNPWITIKQRKILDGFINFYYPLLSVNSDGLTGFRRILLKFLQRIIEYRFTKCYFNTPIEYTTFKIYKKIKKLIAGQEVFYPWEESYSRDLV